MSDPNSAGNDIQYPYGYVPTKSVCGIFIALFGLSTVIHIGQLIFWRTWWLWPTVVLCGLAEVIGWSGRLWSSINPVLLAPYEMQLTTTIIAPTPLVAANFVMLGRIIDRLGTQYSRLRPMHYTIIFCSFDVVSLIVQAVGGATAAGAVNENKSPDNGGNIMLGGIIFQLASIIVYVALVTEYLFRYFTDHPLRGGNPSKIRDSITTGDAVAQVGVLTKRLRCMLIGLMFSTTCIFVRSIYRTIELGNGWNGTVIQTQVYFNVLDGAMIVLAMFTINFAHPGRLLSHHDTPTKASSRSDQIVVVDGNVIPLKSLEAQS